MNVQIPIRLVRHALARLLDMTAVQWFDLAAKTGLVMLYAGILALAIQTGALWDNFHQLYDTPTGAWVMSLLASYSAFMLLVMLVRVLLVAA